MHVVARGEVIVELFQRREKTLHFFLPRQWMRILPYLISRDDTERPIVKVAHMGENLCWRAAVFAARIIHERVGRSAQGLPTTVRNRCQGVAQQGEFLPAAFLRSRHFRELLRPKTTVSCKHERSPQASAAEIAW